MEKRIKIHIDTINNTDFRIAKTIIYKSNIEKRIINRLRKFYDNYFMYYFMYNNRYFLNILYSVFIILHST